MKTVDLSVLECGEDAAVMEVVDPRTGDTMTYEKDGDLDANDELVKHPVTIALFALDGEVGKKAKAALINSRMKRGMLSASKKATAESLEVDALGLLARLVARWDGDGNNCMPYKGTSYACTRENAAMLLDKLPWLRKQVDQFVNDLTNYVGN